MSVRFSVPCHHQTRLAVLHPVRLFAGSPVFVTVTAMLFICPPPRSAHRPRILEKKMRFRGIRPDLILDGI